MIAQTSLAGCKFAYRIGNRIYKHSELLSLVFIVDDIMYGCPDSSYWGYIANEGICPILVKQTSHSIYFLVCYLDIDVYLSTLSP